MSRLAQVFVRFQSDDRWFSPCGLDDESLREIEKETGSPLPEVVKELLRLTNGGEWAGTRLVQFFDDVAIPDVNTGVLPQFLAGTFAFAFDGGSGWYIIDLTNRFERGAGSVWRVPAGAPLPSEVRYVSEDLPAFLEWMIEPDVG